MLVNAWPVNARSKRAGFMVGLRRSFWPMIGKIWTLIAYLNNGESLQFRLNETLGLNDRQPAPRLDRHSLAGHRCRRCGPLDRGAATGGNRAAWAAFAARDRCNDRERLSGAGARTFARGSAGDIPADATCRHLDRAYQFSGNADAVSGRRA